MTENSNTESSNLDQQNAQNDFWQQTEQLNDFATAASENNIAPNAEKRQAAAAEFLAAAQKSQVAAYGAQKNGEKALQMAQKVLQEYIGQPEITENINAESFLHKQLIAVRDSINALNSSLAAEKVGVQLSEEALRKAAGEFDRAQRETDGAQTELMRLQKVYQQQESVYNELLAKQQELNKRIKLEEEKLKSAKAAAQAAEALLADITDKKDAAAALMKEAQEFDKDTRDRYRQLQLAFSQARENASGIITQLRCVNKDLPFDMEEMLIFFEDGEQNSAKTRKKLFGKKNK